MGNSTFASSESINRGRKPARDGVLNKQGKKRRHWKTHKALHKGHWLKAEKLKEESGFTSPGIAGSVNDPRMTKNKGSSFM